MAYGTDGVDHGSPGNRQPGATEHPPPPPPHVQYRSPSGEEHPVVDITPVEAWAPAPAASPAGPYQLVPRNGRGKAAIVFGCLAVVCTGALFFLFPLGLLFGLLAVLFGRSGRDRAGWGGATNGATATAGLALGVVSLVLGTLLTVGSVWLAQRYDVGALRDCVADSADAVGAGHCILDVLDRS